MIHIRTDCFYISVQKTIHIGDWHGASFATKNSMKNSNPDDYFICKSIEIVACCQICNLFSHNLHWNPFYRVFFVLWIFSYCDDVLNYSNLFYMMSVQ